ncbi:MAG: DnaJ domain-containing protein [Polyangiaceae bacterium]|nr:DnaJ domain-containing protein [Polyangiaceae bacterium]MCW5790146.1 DnaJ domain-containing protein [Polyangiaceae bacterium]
MAKDYYQELGVRRGATPDEIKRAYKKLAMELHPDKNPGDTKAEERFKAVNRAHQVLSDEKRRQLYDEFGEDGLREGFDPEMQRAYGGRGRSVSFQDIFGGSARGTGSVGDLFGDLFSGGRRGSAGFAMRGSDLASDVEVSFVEAVQGATRRLTQDGEEVSVRIPAGAQDGDKVRVKGHGAPGTGGGPPGDLVLRIRVAPHPHFERDGLDLQLELPITVAEAFHGAKVRVPTPNGDVTLTVPEGAQSGQRARLKGRGVKRKDKVGDLYVRFSVKLPEARTPEVEQAIATLAAATGEVRGGLTF